MVSRKQTVSSIKAICTKLPEEALVTLGEFAQFLVNKYPEVLTQESIEVNPQPRPKEESVIAAIRRLSKTYPMLDKKILFEQTSTAMTEHVMQDVPTVESIDRLEVVFKKEYTAHLESLQK